jgi:hypothetical protein
MANGTSRTCVEVTAAKYHEPRVRRARFAIGARFDVHRRRDRRNPHLGRVELATLHDDEFARPLPSVIPTAVQDPSLLAAVRR